MKYAELLERAGSLPVVDARSLRGWGEPPASLSVQLSRWTRQGKLIPLRRGIYLLPPSLRRQEPPLEYLANLLVLPSYVSLERALAFHGLIPEAVPLIQSVTIRGPISFRTPVGDFDYRHVKPDWFFGYRETQVPGGSALMATPEKALLDLLYLSGGELTDDRLEALRLQELERLVPGRISRMAKGHGARAERAAKALAVWLRRVRE